MKSKVHCILLPESVVYFSTPFYRLLKKIIIRNIKKMKIQEYEQIKNLSDIVIVVLEKFSVTFWQHLLRDGIDND